MRQIEVLLPYEAKQFDRPPIFNQDERKSFFTLSTELLTVVLKADALSKIGLVLQHGYFKATRKFYKSEQYRRSDIHYVAKLLNIQFTGLFNQDYSNRTRNNHKAKVLDLMGYQLFSKNKEIFKQSISKMVSKQMYPRKMLFSLVDQLREQKIEIPNYDTFARYITEEFNAFESTESPCTESTGDRLRLEVAVSSKDDWKITTQVV